MEPPTTRWRLTSSASMQLLAWRGRRLASTATCERLLVYSSTCVHCPITHFTANRCFRQVDAGPGKGRGEPAENYVQHWTGLGYYESTTNTTTVDILGRLVCRIGMVRRFSLVLRATEDVAHACAQPQSSTVVSPLPSP
jgi:hypothetical protein